MVEQLTVEEYFRCPVCNSKNSKYAGRWIKIYQGDIISHVFKTCAKESCQKIAKVTSYRYDDGRLQEDNNNIKKQIRNS